MSVELWSPPAVVGSACLALIGIFTAWIGQGVVPKAWIRLIFCDLQSLRIAQIRKFTMSFRQQ